jgi:excinuclease UvrABC ATPase subunit
MVTSFDALIEQEHSILVIKHKMEVTRIADWLSILGVKQMMAVVWCMSAHRQGFL